MPVGAIRDFFYRVEFRERGSPHIHALFWLKMLPNEVKTQIVTLQHLLTSMLTVKVIHKTL